MNTTSTFSSIQVVSADAVEDVLPLALNLEVSAISSDIPEDQTLSMKNTSTLSSIHVFAADATEYVLPLVQGLLDTEADQPRSLISENELSPLFVQQVCVFSQLQNQLLTQTTKCF